MALGFRANGQMCYGLLRRPGYALVLLKGRVTEKGRGLALTYAGSGPAMSFLLQGDKKEIFHGNDLG